MFRQLHLAAPTVSAYQVRVRKLIFHLLSIVSVHQGSSSNCLFISRQLYQFTGSVQATTLQLKLCQLTRSIQTASLQSPHQYQLSRSVQATAFQLRCLYQISRSHCPFAPTVSAHHVSSGNCTSPPHFYKLSKSVQGNCVRRKRSRV